MISQVAINQRSDRHLREAVLLAFKTKEDTAHLDLRVGVLNAIVHLADSVPTRGIWEKAEQIAASVLGVRGVVNRIEAPGAPSPTRTINLNLPPASGIGEYEHER